MHASLTTGRIHGIEISLHWSWLVILALIVWTLADAVFPETAPGRSGATYLAMAVAGALVFFASLLLHELGHSLQAQREGMRIEGITLWLFGGVARFSGAFPGARTELRVALAGPGVTGAIVVLLGLLLLLPLPAVVGDVVGWLAVVNIVLLVFNLLPAVPLDGGRVLHALLWRSSGDAARSTLRAAAIGRAFGYGLIGGGMALFLLGVPASGVWLVFLGWFLLAAASAEGRDALLHEVLRDLRVSDLMVHHPVVATPEQTLASFMDEVAHVHRYTTYPVVDHERAVGLLPFSRVAATPRGLWETEHVGDRMLPPASGPALAPGMAVGDALEQMQANGVDRALVLEGERLAGLLSITDIGRLVAEATSGGRRGESR